MKAAWFWLVVCAGCIFGTRYFTKGGTLSELARYLPSFTRPVTDPEQEAYEQAVDLARRDFGFDDSAVAGLQKLLKEQPKAGRQAVRDTLQSAVDAELDKDWSWRVSDAESRDIYRQKAYKTYASTRLVFSR